MGFERTRSYIRVLTGLGGPDGHKLIPLCNSPKDTATDVAGGNNQLHIRTQR